MGSDTPSSLALDALNYALKLAESEEWNLGEQHFKDDAKAPVGLIAVRKMRAAIEALLSASETHAGWTVPDPKAEDAAHREHRAWTNDKPLHQQNAATQDKGEGTYGTAGAGKPTDTPPASAAPLDFERWYRVKYRNESGRLFTRGELHEAFLVGQGASLDQSAITAPEGWKLVPVQATAEMVQAAEDRHVEGATYIAENSIQFALWREVYRAMLAAAPARPDSAGTHK